MKLSYQMTNTFTGEKINIWEERNDGRQTTHYRGPFQTEDEAKAVAKKYEEDWGFGYSGSASVAIMEDQIYVRCSRWNSCD